MRENVIFCVMGVTLESVSLSQCNGYNTEERFISHYIMREYSTVFECVSLALYTGYGFGDSPCISTDGKCASVTE